ncbi:MAG: hypothetical protein MRERC_5c102 [Mycoplasmataceae bacterium RC_NB112A]|nr:MAG: hypothetical protein MRERC_5c102 [Mycoplasmataceae bacterium RC_NB112A]
MPIVIILLIYKLKFFGFKMLYMSYDLIMPREPF